MKLTDFVLINDGDSDIKLDSFVPPTQVWKAIWTDMAAGDSFDVAIKMGPVNQIITDVKYYLR